LAEKQVKERVCVYVPVSMSDLYDFTCVCRRHWSHDRV